MMFHHLRSVTLLVALFWTAATTTATRHSFAVRHDARRFIGPVTPPFGFLVGGLYNITVLDFEVTVHQRHRQEDHQAALNYVEAGFLLKRFSSESAFEKYHEKIYEKPSLCIYEPHRMNDFVSTDTTNTDDDLLTVDDDHVDSSKQINIEPSSANGSVYLSMNQPELSWKPHTATITKSFDKRGDEGFYFLAFQLCPRDPNFDLRNIEFRTSFELDLHFINYDAFGNRSYLTAGEMPLPGMFLYFTASYLLCFFLWAINIRQVRMGHKPIWTSSQPRVHSIHHLMTILLGLKTTVIFLESLRYYHIRAVGHAEFLSTLYFILKFAKGVAMFTVVLLIGSGWSLLKPCLNVREKRIIWTVLLLQVIDNIAVAILSNETLGEALYEDWSALLHLVDILCCCAILIPIVWSVNALEKSIEQHQESASPNNSDEGEKVKTVQKLKLFQRFYLLVVVYIYFTRILVFIFATTLGFKQTWLRHFVTELGTLVFYCIVGFLFRPVDENPYLEGTVEIEFADTLTVETE